VSFVCCVSFGCGVILCDVCYLFVVIVLPLPPGKNPFAVKINNNNNNYLLLLAYLKLHI
jgi:hypothetical protein